MNISTIPHSVLFVVFCIGYAAIIFEYLLKVNKTAVALLLAVTCWMLFFVWDPQTIEEGSLLLSHHLSAISQILFFLLGAMTLVELIDSHKGFEPLSQILRGTSYKKMLWIVACAAFFLSALLDNLTTTILMLSLLKKLIEKRSERVYHSIMVVIAANAGGAWTPIGDVTTTMLWIGGQISSIAVIKALFLPSIISMVIPLFIFTTRVKNSTEITVQSPIKGDLEPGGKLVFICGICSFLFVPLFKWATGMPPFMGMLIALAVMWLITDVMHYQYEQREHLRIPFILTKIDVSNILFFLGILLAVAALDVTGLLKDLAVILHQKVGSIPLIATCIGILSAIIDNVPLVAATMGMYSLVEYPLDSNLWMLIAYAAGTGGSMLLIGSSSGVALMGMEKTTFVEYLKKATIPVFLGYIAGILIFIFL